MSDPTILVAEDERDIRELISFTLQFAGFEVELVSNGVAAVEKATEVVPDLILMDVQMPEMDGYEVCRRLKSDERTDRIPVIFITALVDEEDEAKGLGLGAVDYITKPINPELVRARVRNHLEVKHYQDHLENLVIERIKRFALTQDVTIRFPIYLTLIMALLTLSATFRMTDTKSSLLNDECSALETCGLTMRGIVLQTLGAGKWILQTPFAMVIISGTTSQ